MTTTDGTEDSQPGYKRRSTDLSPTTGVRTDLRTALLAAVALVGMAGAFYSLDRRIAIIEMQRTGVSARLDRIEVKLDAALREQRREHP